MSTPNPISLDPVVLLGSAFITFLTGKYIESAGSAPAQQLAKAQMLLTITKALEEVNGGNLAGLSALQTAVQNLVNTIKDPAASMALNELMAILGTELAQIASGSLIGKLSGMAANLIVTQIATTAQAYVTALSTPAVAAA